jgi:zinc protease
MDPSRPTGALHPSPGRRRSAARVVLWALIGPLAALALLVTLAHRGQARQTLDPQALIPFDAAVRTGTLPNGLTFYVRQNVRPAGRVLLRLAVKAGSLDERDDAQGVAHFLEHMAFNGSAHFEPGEFISYFESIGARMGPHLNAYTGFEETVYMLDLPSDKAEIVARGLTALADIAGGLTIDPEQVERERGVVIEEWRGGLGAASRVRDRQVPVLYYRSRYAERLPIGKPDVIRTAPAARIRAFYDTFYRPDRMAVVAVGDADLAPLEASIRRTFDRVRTRSEAPPPRRDDTMPLHEETLVSVVSDPEVQRSSVTMLRKRPREPESRVADYRRSLMQRVAEHIINERFEDLVHRPDAQVLGLGAADRRLSPGVTAFSLTAGVADGRLDEGARTLVTEASRLTRYGVGPAELDRAKRWMGAFYDRAFAEREKTESASYAREYVSHFLVGEPSPGIAYEYRMARQFVPAMTTAEVSALVRQLLGDTSRVVLAVSPEKTDVHVPSEQELRAAIAASERLPVQAWPDAATTRALMEHVPEPAQVVGRHERADLGLTIVRFANGLEAWLKPTDFKNDEVLFTMYSPGGLSLAPRDEYVEASLATTYVGLSGTGGLKALELQKLLAGQLASVSPYISLEMHGIGGSAVPAQLETALQLLHQRFVAPGDDPDALRLLKRQLDAALANRDQNPMVVFGEKVADVNSSGHYASKPVTREQVASLDRARMLAFYKARFSNASDFTLFMAGAFQTDQVIPLLARYVGTLPSTGRRTSQVRDVGLRFPDHVERARVTRGREPRSQAVISFFADPPPDPAEQERVAAATDVLEIALRDVLREQLGQTYSVSVNLSQQLPLRGAGYIAVGFGANPANLDGMIARVLQEVERLQTDGPTPDLTTRAKEAARRTHETALRQNGYWTRSLQAAHFLGYDPRAVLERSERIAAVTPAALRDVFGRYFPRDRRTVVTLVPAFAPEASTQVGYRAPPE